MCVRAHEHVPTSLTCPSSVHRPPHPPHTHIQLPCHPEENRWRGTGTHRPGANSGLRGHEMTSARTGRRPRPQVGDSAHRGAWPQEAAQMPIPARISHRTASRGANGLLLPWKTEDCAMTAVLCSSKGGGHLWAPGIALGADAHRTPGSHLLSKQNVDLQLILAGRILSSVQEEIDMDSGGCWGTRGAF